jgi:hypothetical protein
LKTLGVGRVEVLQLRVASATLAVTGGSSTAALDDDSDAGEASEEDIAEPTKRHGSSSNRDVVCTCSMLGKSLYKIIVFVCVLTLGQSEGV